MGLFDIFKKKEQEPSYDPSNITVHDLDFGFILEYDLKSWRVEEVYEYDWGNNHFSWEYMINSGDDRAFLHVSDNAGTELTLTREIKIRKLDEDLVDVIIKTEQAPSKLFWEGEKYFLDADSAGYCKDHSDNSNSWDELISYDYYNEDEDKIISITQWDERNFEAYAGKVLKNFEISNIIPAD